MNFNAKQKLVLLFSIPLFLFAGLAMAATARLVASDGAAFDAFGRAVASTEKVIVVGAPNADVGGRQDQGAVYVFVRHGRGWREAAKLVAADGTAGAAFGADVVMTNDIIVTGAPHAVVDGEPERGAAYVFVRRGDTWAQAARLVSAKGAPFEAFGASVAIDRRTILVGAPNAAGHDDAPDGFSAGAVFVFERRSGGWQQSAMLRPAQPVFPERFGSAVALDGDTAVIGAPAAQGHAGRAFVFERGDAGWKQSAILAPERAASAVNIGADVDIKDGVIALGAVGDGFFDEVYRSGRVYVYEKHAKGWGPGSERLAATDPTVNGGFGFGVSLTGERLAVGARPVGNAYLFADRPAAWTETGKFSTRESSYGFGTSVSLTPGLLVVGNDVATVDGRYGQGAVHVFDLP